jgi:hypothetical protein
MESRVLLVASGWIAWSVLIVIGILAVLGAFAFGMGAFGAAFGGGEFGAAGRMVLIAFVLFIGGAGLVVAGTIRIARSRSARPTNLQ